MKKESGKPTIQCHCVHCGKPFLARRKTAKYYDKSHAMAHYRAIKSNKAKKNAKKAKPAHKPVLPEYPVICAGCGATFWRAGNSKRMYCPDTSNACKQRAYRRARSAGAGRSESYTGKRIDKRTKAYREQVKAWFNGGNK
jgi:hypothetical protein